MDKHDSKQENISSQDSTNMMRDEKLRAEAARRWGKTPSSQPDDDAAKLLPDHPVHQIPLDKQQKMRERGINPVLKAEMDQMTKGQGKERKFWSKYGLTSMGSWRT